MTHAFARRFRTLIAALVVLASSVTTFGQKNADADTHANRIINTTLTVRDLDRAVRFYVEGLGMHERGRRTASKDVTEFSVGYSDDPRVSELMLIHNKARSAQASVDTTSAASASWGHIILEIKDLKTTLENVTKAGGRVLRPPAPNASVPVIVAFVEDPDGHQFELVQFK